ncbi:unnamed protein product [Protopolystoma xenopodis]|uniref:Uncharacterized protein n=1 Tax=Protopolystoma xenopodis TaxID=117903 RepID=A0A3S5A7M1_9PLAT|nr:unnamed protein product [Protopolystoma xenopodis]
MARFELNCTSSSDAVVSTVGALPLSPPPSSSYPSHLSSAYSKPHKPLFSYPQHTTSTIHSLNKATCSWNFNALSDDPASNKYLGSEMTDGDKEFCMLGNKHWIQAMPDHSYDSVADRRETIFIDDGKFSTGVIGVAEHLCETGLKGCVGESKGASSSSSALNDILTSQLLSMTTSQDGLSSSPLLASIPVSTSTLPKQLDLKAICPDIGSNIIINSHLSIVDDHAIQALVSHCNTSAITHSSQVSEFYPTCEPISSHSCGYQSYSEPIPEDRAKHNTALVMKEEKTKIYQIPQLSRLGSVSIFSQGSISSSSKPDSPIGFSERVCIEDCTTTSLSPAIFNKNVPTQDEYNDGPSPYYNLTSAEVILLLIYLIEMLLLS